MGATERSTSVSHTVEAERAEGSSQALLVLLFSVFVNLIGTTAYSPMLSIHARNLGASRPAVRE